jgi:hypothetical protein
MDGTTTISNPPVTKSPMKTDMYPRDELEEPDTDDDDDEAVADEDDSES